MNILKIKVSDEPRILVSAIRHPFRVILSLQGTTDTLSGIIEDDYFVYMNDDHVEFNKMLGVLTKSKINFCVEYHDS